MKIKVTNQWILDFNTVRAYLNLVGRDTNRPLISLGRDLMYAMKRTGNKVKDDVSILAEEDKKREVIENKLRLAKADGGLETKSLEEELKKHKSEWQELLKKEIDIEVHTVKLSDFPDPNPLPEHFFNTLAELIQEDEKK